MAVSRRQFLKAGVVTALVPSLVGRVEIGLGAVKEESRAIMDEGLNWASKESAERVCNRLARAGFNVFIPCVWHGRGTIWSSKLAPWDRAAIHIQETDPLSHLLRVASSYGIEVHPWFTVALRERDFLPEFHHAGSVPETFDVHRAEFRDFIVSLVLEVVGRYPVHGVNLDYTRTGGICTSPWCVELYKKETGRNLLADVSGEYPDEFLAWQEGAVTDIVRRVAEGARRLRSDVIVSVDAAPGHWVDRTQGRNSLKWADDRLIDVVYLMRYEANPDWTALRALKSGMKRPDALVMTCGNFEEIHTETTAVVPRQAARVEALLREAQAYQQGNGVGLYLYSMLTDEHIAHLRQTVFRDPARPSWKRAWAANLSPPAGVKVD